MEINRLSQLYTGKSIQELKQIEEQIVEASKKLASTDSVEISSAAKKLSKLEHISLDKEKLEELKKLDAEEMLITQERIRLGIRRMLILTMFS